VMGNASPGQTLLIEAHLASGKCARCAEMAASARAAAGALSNRSAASDGVLDMRPRSGLKKKLACVAALGAAALLVGIAPRVLHHAGAGRVRTADPPYVPLEIETTLGPTDGSPQLAVPIGARPKADGGWVLSWEPVSGAVAYIVRIHGADGAVAQTERTDNAWLDVPGPGPGQRVRWSVVVVMPDEEHPKP